MRKKPKNRVRVGFSPALTSPNGPKNKDQLKTLNISKKTVLFLKITEERVDSLSTKEDDIDEVLSDFSYYSARIGAYLHDHGIASEFVTKNELQLKYNNGQVYMYNRTNLDHLVGTILADGQKEPKVLAGVFTDLDLREELIQYFNIRQN